MLALIRRPVGPRGSRRGVTLVEMLVVVALVVLMMVILVQIFQVATGAMSASRTIQELDTSLRQADSIIRSDLGGVTACMDPTVKHNNPLVDARGYFEYGENAPADAQGEDSDDYLAFTTRAPDGKLFSGRQWLGGAGSAYNQNIQPATITSPVAEVIYFLRNGNLYRRVFLVVPERQKSVSLGTVGAFGFYTPIFGGGLTPVSWQGMNDISARPGPNGTATVLPVFNSLADLTNRENRSLHPRFNNDYYNPGGGNGDGIPDDLNADGKHDYWPTLYTDGTGSHGGAPNGFVNEASSAGRVATGSYSVYAFPYIYPGMYSVPDPARLNALGWVHYLYPGTDPNFGTANNHNALDTNDNLVAPTAQQTWWGFPTWRETMAGLNTSSGTTYAGWTDPINFVGRAQNGTYSQPVGLIPFPPTTTPNHQSINFPPPLGTFPTANQTLQADPNAGSANLIAIPGNPGRVWEDDLLLTGVRSFDVKAYDASAPLYNTTVNGYFSAGYLDLGYGAGSYVGGPGGTGTSASLPSVLWQNSNTVGTPGSYYEPIGFGHEGRIPPAPFDFRLHPRRKQVYSSSAGGLVPYNIGDSSAGVIRLTRVWDSWSTDYTDAPDVDYLGTQGAGTYALYPSFPAPYPSALRGIQIQIRLADPRGERAKMITIRQDFTDKLQ